MNKILVTGATGFIGFEVARQLSVQEACPRLLVRRPLRGALVATLDAELMQGDLLRPKSLQRAVKGINTIIHLGARATFEDYTFLRPSIVDGSIELMKAAQEAGVKQFVYASSLLVYANQCHPIDQNTFAESQLGYARAKREAEAHLAQLAQESGMTFASIRLPHVYGARDLIFDQIRQGRAIHPGKGDNLYAHMHIEDAARVMIRVAQVGWSGVSAVADDCPATWREFFSVVSEYYPQARIHYVPKWAALFGTMVLSRLRSQKSRPFLYTPDAVRGANLTLPVKPGLLWDHLGIQPRYSTVDQGIPSALDECVAFRWLHSLADRS